MKRLLMREELLLCGDITGKALDLFIDLVKFLVLSCVLDRDLLLPVSVVVTELL